MATVFVSGASGFIAQEIIKQLLQKNHHVVGSVRSQSKGESIMASLKSANLPIDKFTYEIIPDISTSHAFDNALQNHPDITVFLHTASPFHFRAKNIEQELLIPAIEGTKNALDSIQKYAPQVKKVVITSSVVSVGKFGGKYINTKQIDEFNETSWNPIDYETSKKNTFYGYFGSKKFAELAAWEFIKERNPKFDLVVINPGMVFGPQAFPIKNNRELNTSSEEINRLLKLKPGDKVNVWESTFIDVRDVARAHILAFEKGDQTKGKRLLLISDMYNDQKLLNIVNKHYSELGLPKGNPGKAGNVKRFQKWNTEETKKILGFEYIGLEQSVVDSVKQILESKSYVNTNSKL